LSQLIQVMKRILCGRRYYFAHRIYRNTKYYKISGEFDKDASLSLDIEVPVSLDVWSGYKKGSKIPFAVVTSDNPHLIITDIRSIK